MSVLSIWGRAAAVAAGLGLAGAGLSSCGPAEPPRAAAAPAAPDGEVRLPAGSPELASVEVETVGSRGEKVVAVLPAQLVLDEDHTVRVAPPVAGRVQSVDAAPGDRLARGAALAHVVSPDVGQAQTDLARAEATLAQAAATLSRSRDLYAHHVIAQRDLQQAESDEAGARAERDRARERVRLLGCAPGVDQEFVLRSPIAGDVVDRSANPGAEIRPDNAQALFTVSDLDTLWLVASVYPQDIGRVRRGEELEFVSESLPGQALRARVRYVSGTLDPQTHTATLRACLPNPGHRLPAQVFGEVRVLAPDTRGFPVVPVRSLVTRGDEETVYVEAGPGRFVRRTVRLGEDDGRTAEVVSGLRPGERVVTRGSIFLASDAGSGQ